MEQSIQDILCDAIQIIAQSISGEVKPDRTIEAIVCGFADRETNELTEQNTGYYQLKYQDAYIYASNNNPLVIYPINTRVYVQVINGEMNQSKMIIGPADGEETQDTFLGAVNSNTEALRGDVTTNYFKKTQNEDDMPEFVENQTYFQKNVNIVCKSKLNIHGDINVTKEQDEQDAGNVNIGRNLVVAEQTNLQGALTADAASTFKDDVSMETNLTVAQNITTNLITFDGQEATFVQDDQGYICVKHPQKLEIEQSNLRVATTEFAKTAGTKPVTLQVGGVGTPFRWFYSQRVQYPKFEWKEEQDGTRKYVVDASCCLSTASAEEDRTNMVDNVRGLSSVTINVPNFMTECPDVVEITARKSSLRDDVPCLFRWEWKESQVTNEQDNTKSTLRQIIVRFYAIGEGSLYAKNKLGIKAKLEEGAYQIMPDEIISHIGIKNIPIVKRSRKTICFDIFCAKTTEAEETDITSSNISYEMDSEDTTEQAD